MHCIKPEDEARIRAGDYRIEGTTAVLVSDAGEVVLHHRDNIPTIRYPDHWSLPGGAIELGETAEEAIRRELLEEMEYEPGEVELYGQILDDYANLINVFVGRMDRPADELRLHEGREVRLFNPASLPAKTTPHARLIIQDYFSVSEDQGTT